jgi:tetratricopeptide (TPR) repeat protein
MLVGLPNGPATQAQEFWLPASADTLVQRARADSNDPVAHHLVALAWLNEGKWDRAERAFREALAVNPRYAAAHLGVAVLVIAQNPDEFAPPWMRRNRRGRVVQLDSLLGVVSEAVRTALLIDPLVDLPAPDAPVDTAPPRHVADNAPVSALWDHARATAKLGRFEPGIHDLGLIVRRSWREEHRDSAHPLAYLLTNDMRYMEAYWRDRVGRAWAAEQGYRQVLAFDLGFWMAHVRLGDLYERLGRLEESLAERRQAAFLNPGDPMLQVDLALTLGRLGRLEAADSAFADAETRLPRYSLIPYHRGQIAWLRNDAAAARAAFERFLALAPRNLARQIEDARVSLMALP